MGTIKVWLAGGVCAVIAVLVFLAAHFYHQHIDDVKTDATNNIEKHISKEALTQAVAGQRLAASESLGAQKQSVALTQKQLANETQTAAKHEAIRLKYAGKNSASDSNAEQNESSENAISSIWTAYCDSFPSDTDNCSH